MQKINLQNLLKHFAVMLLAGAIFVSCKSKSDIGKLIPADAVAVAYFDTKSLLDKLPFEDIKSTQMFKDIYADSSLPQWSKKMLDDPKKAGIDLSKGLIGFADKGTGEDYNLVVEGFISNAGDFETFNKNMDPAQTVTNEKNIKTLILHNKSVVGWNDKNFVYVLNVTEPKNNYEWDQSDSLPKLPEGNLTAAKAYLQKIFTLSESKSLANEDRFNSLMKENGDMKMWVNSEKIFQLSPAPGMLGMLKIDVLIKDSRATYTINFDKGKIDVDQKAYYGKEMTDFIKKNTGDNIKEEDIAKIPSTDIIGIMAANYKPEAIKELTKLIGVDGMINMYASQLGVSLDDLVNGIDGKMLLSFSDLKTTPSTDTTEYSAPHVDFNYLFKMGVRNQQSFQKVMDALLKAAGAITSATDFPYVLNDKIFVLSNHKEFADSYVAGKSENKPEWRSKITGHPFGLYVSINKILTAMPATKDSLTNATIEKSKAFWNDLYATGGELSAGALTIKTEVNLMDQNSNSLKQMNTYMDQMYQLNKGRRKNKEWRYYAPSSSVDSTIEAPVEQ